MSTSSDKTKSVLLTLPSNRIRKWIKPVVLNMSVRAVGPKPIQLYQLPIPASR